MATQKLSPKETAARQERKCLKAGAAHPLLKAAGHEKCWKCGKFLQNDFYQALADLIANTGFDGISNPVAVVHPLVMRDLIKFNEWPVKSSE